jgi:predicted RND superfamily exporter protein
VKLDVTSIAGRLVPALVRHHRLVLAAAALLTLLGAYFSTRLYGDLRSDVEELLPADAPSVVAARTIGPKVHNVNHLSVVMEGTDGDAIDRFADDLAKKLRTLPHEQVASVDYRTDEQEAFLHQFGSLYLELGDLKTISGQLDARIAWEKQHAVKAGLDLVGDQGDDTPAPPLEFSAIEKKYAQATGAMTQFRKGYYQTPDGKILAMLVRPPELATGYTSNKALLDTVRGFVASMHPESYDPTLRVGFNGDVSSLVEEQEALIEDLASSTAVVLIFVMLALWLYFRRWSAILAISAALAASTAITFGLGYFMVGHLNANTAFLGSIVLGNGINVSIILVARYLEERRKGLPIAQAIEIAWAGTLTATFVASFGAGLAYLSLSTTDFRGFSQFGLLGGAGMALCWIGAYLLLPPLLVLIDSDDASGVPAPHRPVFGAAVAWLVERHNGLVRAASALLLLASIGGVLSYKGHLIEYDLAKLRSQKSARNGAVYWGGKVDQVFKAYLTPIAVRAETPAELDAFAAALEQGRKASGAADPVREIRTLRTVIPPDQAEKLPLLEKIRSQLTDSRIALLDPELQKKARALKPPPDLHTVTLADLPESFRLPLTERDGTSGRIALIFPSAMGSMGPKELEEISAVIRGAVTTSHARAMAVGQALLFQDISKSILVDGPKATLFAFAMVCLLVIVAFRRLGPSLQVLGGLVLGVAWLVGWAAFAQVRLNFLNFVVLPITFGIGVDYAANIVQRQRLEGPGSLARVLRETGGAVALCSATTSIGYASLLVADSRALAGFGLLASLGEVACLTAALLALPAWTIRRADAAPRTGLQQESIPPDASKQPKEPQRETA